MTDEEKLAEEYVKSVIDINAFDWKIVREIGLAYIAGLKAGSQLDRVWHDYDAGEDCYEDSHEGKWVKRETSEPKWHKVADGDLPRQDGHTCFSIEVLANNKKWVYYRFDSAKWFCGSKEVKVIAWCEKPEYKEE